MPDASHQLRFRMLLKSGLLPGGKALMAGKRMTFQVNILYVAPRQHWTCSRRCAVVLKQVLPLALPAVHATKQSAPGAYDHS